MAHSAAIHLCGDSALDRWSWVGLVRFPTLWGITCSLRSSDRHKQVSHLLNKLLSLSFRTPPTLFQMSLNQSKAVQEGAKAFFDPKEGFRTLKSSLIASVMELKTVLSPDWNMICFRNMIWCFWNMICVWNMMMFQQFFQVLMLRLDSTSSHVAL